MNRIVSAALALGLLASPAAAQLRVTKRADLAAPVELAPNQRATLLAFSRPDAKSAGKAAVASFARYDMAKRDLVYQPKGAKRAGDTTTYWVTVTSAERRKPVEYHLLPVVAGDYVLYGAMPDKLPTNSFCMGAPAFGVKPGEVVYFGDMTPFVMVRMASGDKANAMAYSANLDGARAALAGPPELAAKLRAADLRNGATYACAGQSMLAYAAPGAPSLPPAGPVQKVPATASAGR